MLAWQGWLHVSVEDPQIGDGVWWLVAVAWNKDWHLQNLHRAALPILDRERHLPSSSSGWGRAVVTGLSRRGMAKARGNLGV